MESGGNARNHFKDMNLPFPKKIDRYIMKKFIGTFCMALLLIIGIVIIFDISEKINYFVKNSAPLKEIVIDYYLNFVPYFVNMFSPLFVFITVIFFTSRLAANSEIIAILSGGVSYHRMMVPYIVSATIICLFSLGLNFYVIPSANKTRVEFESKYIKRHTNFNLRNIHYQTAPGQFVYMESFSRWNSTAYRFTIEDIEDNQLVKKVSAESAQWDTTIQGWKLKKVFIREYSHGLDDRIEYRNQIDTVIALKLKDLFNNEKTVETLTLGELSELIDTQNMRGDANVMYAELELHRRLSMPFSAIILTIMGVTLSAKKKRGGIGWNIGIGIAMAFSYILFQRFSEMFVYTNTLPAAIALWIPNVLYAIVAAIMYSIASK